MDSPWLKRAEAAELARCHPRTILRALLDYEATDGRRGLKGTRRGEHANAAWLILRSDLDDWLTRRQRAA